MRALISLMVLSVVASATHADSRAYGSETLAYMLKHAHVVVRVGKVAKLYEKEAPSIVGYQITFKEVLYGDKSLRGAIVDFPVSLLPGAEDFAGSLLFVEKDGQSYFSSGDWLVKVSEKERQKAAISLIAATSVELKLRWSREWIESSEVSVQRSAVLVAGDLGKNQQKEAISFLVKVLDNPKVTLLNKVEAVRELGFMQSPDLLQILRNVAENQKYSFRLRQEGIKSIIGREGWRSIVEEWSNSHDRFLSAIAPDILEKFSQGKK